jgi:hypothetical protein
VERNNARTFPLTEFNDENQHWNHAPLAPAQLERAPEQRSRPSRSDNRQNIRPVITPNTTATRNVRTNNTPTLPPTPELRPFLMNRNEEESSLPSLDEVVQEAINNSVADSLSRVVDVPIPLSERFYLNEECTQCAKEIMREPDKFHFTHLKHLNIYDTLSILISTAAWNIVKSCGLESNYAGVISQCEERLLFAPLETLVRVSTTDNGARKYYRSLNSPSYCSTDMSKVAIIDFEELLGPIRLREIKSGSPPVEECFKAIEMVIKRRYPHKYEEIRDYIKSKDPTPQNFIKLIMGKGEVLSFIGWSDIDLTNEVPKISCLTRLEEEVEREKNDELEGFSMNSEVGDYQPERTAEDNEERPQEEQAETLVQQEGTEDAKPQANQEPSQQRVNETVDQNSDVQLAVLNQALTPMADLADWSRRTGNEVVISRTMYSTSVELVGLEASSYMAKSKKGRARAQRKQWEWIWTSLTLQTR